MVTCGDVSGASWKSENINVSSKKHLHLPTNRSFSLNKRSFWPILPIFNYNIQWQVQRGGACWRGVPHHKLGRQREPEGRISSGYGRTRTEGCILSEGVKIIWREWWLMRFYKRKLSYGPENLQALLIIFMSLFTVHPKGNFCNCFLCPFIITYKNMLSQSWMEAYPSGFGLCVHVLLSCVSFKAICRRKCDFLFIYHQNIKALNSYSCLLGTDAASAHRTFTTTHLV